MIRRLWAYPAPAIANISPWKNSLLYSALRSISRYCSSVRSVLACVDMSGPHVHLTTGLVARHRLVLRRRRLAGLQGCQADVDLRHGARLERLPHQRVVAGVPLFAQQLAPETRFEFGQLALDLRGLALVAHHVFAIALEEVADSLDANADGAGRLVLVDILEAKVGRAGVLHDLFHHRVNGGVV